MDDFGEKQKDLRKGPFFKLRYNRRRSMRAGLSVREIYALDGSLCKSLSEQLSLSIKHSFTVVIDLRCLNPDVDPGYLSIRSGFLKNFLRQHGLSSTRIGVKHLIKEYNSMKESMSRLAQGSEERQEVQLLLNGFMRDSDILRKLSPLTRAAWSEPSLLSDIVKSKLSKDLHSIEDAFYIGADKLDAQSWDIDPSVLWCIRRSKACDQYDNASAEEARLESLEEILRRRIRPVPFEALRLLIENHDIEALQVILKHSSNSALGGYLNCALLTAVQARCKLSVELLLEYGANPNFKPRWWDPVPLSREDPLSAALLRNDFDIALLLVEAGGIMDNLLEHLVRDEAKERGVEWFVDKFVNAHAEPQRTRQWIELFAMVPPRNWGIWRYNSAFLTSSPANFVDAEFIDSKALQQCPLIEGIRTREAKNRASAKRSALKGVHHNLLAAHNNFVTCSDNHESERLKSFAHGLGSYRSVFKLGMKAMRRLLNNSPPDSLRDVFACIQVADAMRESISSEDFEIVELNSHEKRWLTRTEFAEDLNRWALFLRDHEKSLFDEIVTLVWDKPLCDLAPAEYSKEVNLDYFQRILRVLVSDTASLQVASSGEQESDGHCDVSTGCGQNCAAVSAHPSSAQFDSSTSAEDARCKPELPPLGPNEAFDVNVVVVVAGAIFSFIVAFLCVIMVEIPLSTLSLEIWNESWRVFGQRNALTRNCCLWLFYVGFWTVQGVNQDDNYHRDSCDIADAYEPTSDAMTVTEDGTWNQDGQNVYSGPSDHPMDMGMNIDTNMDTILDMSMNIDIQDSLIFGADDPEDLLSEPVMDEYPELPTEPTLQFANTFWTHSNSYMSSTSTSDTNGTPATDVSQSKLQCNLCGQSFTSSSNRSKHEKSDCRYRASTKYYPCRNRGCRKVSNRKDNRDKHERKHCAFR